MDVIIDLAMPDGPLENIGIYAPFTSSLFCNIFIICMLNFSHGTPYALLGRSSSWDPFMPTTTNGLLLRSTGPTVSCSPNYMTHDTTNHRVWRSNHLLCMYIANCHRDSAVHASIAIERQAAPFPPFPRQVREATVPRSALSRCWRVYQKKGRERKKNAI